MSARRDEMTWLFDLGNSRLKGACLEHGALTQAFTLEWNAAVFDKALHARLARRPAPARVMIASVADPERAQRVAAALAACTSAPAEWLRSPREACGVRNRYRVPERFGIDRFLALVAAREAARGSACLVAGCGTALTLDALDAEGVQGEGLIAPSPQLMMRALRGGTAIESVNPHAFAEPEEADDTARAIIAGCEGAARVLVARYAAHWRRQAGFGACKVYLHGGWAPHLRAWLAREPLEARVLKDAVLRGLAIAARSPAWPRP